MRRLLVASLALIACGGAAPAPIANAADSASNEARLAHALKGLTPGKPVNCIAQIRPSYTTEAIGDAILYKINNKLIYRNDTTGGCTAQNRYDALVARNFGTRLCRGNIIRTVDTQSGVEAGGCSLGTFTPYTKAN